VSSELKRHKKNNYAYYQKIVVSYNYMTISVQGPFYQIVESNRKIDSSAWIDSNRIPHPESVCSIAGYSTCNRDGSKVAAWQRSCKP